MIRAAGHEHDFSELLDSETDDGVILHDYYKCHGCDAGRMDVSRIPQDDEGHPMMGEPLTYLDADYFADYRQMLPERPPTHALADPAILITGPPPAAP